MDYKLLFDTAVYAGEILMKSGAETYRVEDTIYRILKKSNLKTIHVLVMMTGFMVTLDDPSMDSLTVVRRINSRGMNLSRIDRVNDISRDFCADIITLEEAFHEIKIIWKEQPKTKKNLVAMMALTGGFAIMFGANLSETMLAAFVGFVSAWAVYFCRRLHLHMFLENCISCIILALTIGISTRVLVGTYDQNVVIISSIMPFVPGAAITNAVFDTVHGDYLSGLARAAEAFVIAAAVATGIGIGMTLT